MTLLRAPNKIMKSQNELILLLIAGVILAAIQTGLIYPRFFSRSEIKACTMEAKLCPDGSSVGRSGPNCEFVKCPNLPKSDFGISNTSTWKTYRNEKYGFEVKYPSDWEFQDISNKSCSPLNCLFSLVKRASNQKVTDLDFHDGATIDFSVSSSLTDAIKNHAAYFKGYSNGKDFSDYGFQGSSDNESDYGVSAFQQLTSGTVVVFDWNRIGNTAEDLSYDKILTQILSTFKFTK